MRSEKAHVLEIGAAYKVSNNIDLDFAGILSSLMIYCES